MKNFIQANAVGGNNKRSISGDHFYIGDGIMRWSNFFVALDHVELVAKYQQQKDAAVGALALMCIGGIALVAVILGFILRSPETVVIFLVLGGALLAGGILLFNYHEKIQMPYLVQIRLGSGHQITLTSISETFIDEIMRVIEQCINDRNGVYQVLLNEGVIQHSETGSIYTIGRDAMPWENVFTAQKEPAAEQEMQVSSGVSCGPGEDEWMRLGKFLIRRIADFTPEQEEYGAIEKLMSITGKRDQEKAKSCLRGMGKENLVKIFGKAETREDREEMLTIIKKILQ